MPTEDFAFATAGFFPDVLGHLLDGVYTARVSAYGLVYRTSLAFDITPCQRSRILHNHRCGVGHALFDDDVYHCRLRFLLYVESGPRENGAGGYPAHPLEAVCLALGLGVYLGDGLCEPTVGDVCAFG